MYVHVHHILFECGGMLLDHVCACYVCDASSVSHT